VADHDAAFEHGVEQFAVEQFVAHRAVESFDVAVLLWCAFLDERRGLAVLAEPVDEGAGDELPAVVGADDRGFPAAGEQSLQDPHHLACAGRTGDVAADRFAGELIDDVEDA
jgi:hypothetical protein